MSSFANAASVRSKPTRATHSTSPRSPSSKSFRTCRCSAIPRTAPVAATKFRPWPALPSPLEPTASSSKSITIPTTPFPTARNRSNRANSRNSWANSASSPRPSAAASCDDGEIFLRTNPDRWTDYLRLIWQDDLDGMRRMTEHDFDLSSKDKEGRTLLMESVLRGSDAMVALLVERGINSNTQDNAGFSALHFAAQE